MIQFTYKLKLNERSGQSAVAISATTLGTSEFLGKDIATPIDIR
jgi:hypothetical protein